MVSALFETQQNSDRLLSLKREIASHFTADNWLEVGTITNTLTIVQGHDRLLRSLSFGDDDYPGACFQVLLRIIAQDPTNLDRIERYVAQHIEGAGINVSSVEGPARVYFTPTVFEVPSQPRDDLLISAMMPFDVGFAPVYDAITAAASSVGMTAMRADNMWEHSAVVQDIFSLIFRSRIVVCDFTGKNPNVFYEAGIAHTLGKFVVPITQNEDHIPFDLRHHRYCKYLNNTEGLGKLTQNLADRFRTLASGGVLSSGSKWAASEW